VSFTFTGDEIGARALVLSQRTVPGRGRCDRRLRLCLVQTSLTYSTNVLYVNARHEMGYSPLGSRPRVTMLA
jgi:hypothetical protein